MVEISRRKGPVLAMKVIAKTTVHDHIVDDCDHSGLSPGRTYTVLQISQDNFRVIDDRAEPILYPKALFDIVDNKIPNGWSFRDVGDGEYFVGPSDFMERGFYEDYFDKEPHAITKFEALRKLSETW